MGRIVSIAEVLKMSPGEIPPCVRGKCVNVWKYRAGDGKDGPYSFQDIVLEDNDGKKLTVSVKNRDEIPWRDAKDKEVTIIAGNSKKDGKLCGVEVVENTYDGVTTMRLSVKPTAELLIGKFDRSQTGGTQTDQTPKMRQTARQDPPPQQTRRQDPPARQEERQEDPPEDRGGHDYSEEREPAGRTEKTPEPPNEPPARPGVVNVYSGAPDDWTEFDARLDKLVRCYQRCCLAAARIGQFVNDKQLEVLIEPQDVVTTLFLSAKGKDIGFMELVPRPSKPKTAQ
jgi:hypothetical protein